MQIYYDHRNKNRIENIKLLIKFYYRICRYMYVYKVGDISCEVLTSLLLKLDVILKFFIAINVSKFTENC